jgi:hypothetical protein
MTGLSLSQLSIVSPSRGRYLFDTFLDLAMMLNPPVEGPTESPMVE